MIISEVYGPDHAEIIHRLNGACPEIFPPLQPHHLEEGYWWLAISQDDTIGFAGMVEFEPFIGVGYLKRAYVMPDYRGHGLQMQFMAAREAKARQLGWTQLVSECRSGSHSAVNFKRAGYSITEPEQRWAGSEAVYWCKEL